MLQLSYGLTRYIGDMESKTSLGILNIPQNKPGQKSSAPTRKEVLNLTIISSGCCIAALNLCMSFVIL
ncbi:hypothetical protein BJX62DRAFT_105615 [Aspergillus germanicus]